MSVEDRLSALLAQARRSGGEALLHDPAALRAQLSAQAPDLHGEIQALAAAIRMGAAARANGVSDPLSERATIAADIARAEHLSLTVVQPAVEVACRAGVAPPSVSSSGGDAWIGDSVMPGAGPPPAPAPAPRPPRRYPPRPAVVYQPPQPAFAGHAAAPFYTRTWFYAAIGALLILGALAVTLLTGGGERGRGSRTAVPPTGSVSAASGAPSAASESTASAPASPAAAGGPTLAPYGGTMPVLRAQTQPGGGVALSFTVSGGGETIDGGLVMPAGWDGETVVTGTNAQGARSVGRGRFQSTRTGNVPMRVMTVTWQQDGVEAGPTMIGFQGQPGQPDVQLSGSIMCVMDGANGQPVGCGRVG